MLFRSLTRPNLMSLFVLVDLRHEPQKNDMDFIEWLAMSQIPFVITFTKSDKLSKLNVEKNLSTYKKVLLQNWEELPPHIITSAITGVGKEELLQYIEKTNRLFSASGFQKK